MAPKKKVAGMIKLQIQAGQPTRPARRPCARSARRQHHGVLQGVQRRDGVQRGNVIPVEITVYEDRSFTFLKTPPAAKLLKKAAGVQKGSAEPHKTKVAKVTKDQVREIAETRRKTSTPTTSTRPPRSSPGPPGRWASRSNRRSEGVESELTHTTCE
jgi:large subunit ribosomal protein L11